MRLPVRAIIRATLFRQFCGGENLADSLVVASHLAKYKIGTILDYAVEGNQNESLFEDTADEIIRTILLAKQYPFIPFCVFKVSGIARADILAKLDARKALTSLEEEKWMSSQKRMRRICETAFKHNVRIFIDAEESWFQKTIDQLTTEMMQLFNQKKAIVYNTLQMYRRDRYGFLEEAYEKAKADGYFLGLKLVRGAYLEKEDQHADSFGLPSPIHKDKESTDRDFDKAVLFCIQHIDRISLCAGTHNENSTNYLIQLMGEYKIDNSDPRVFFSQLLGMSDHLSYNLASFGYQIAKYVPYGEVRVLIPYLLRRAQENTSILGQTTRELALIKSELMRRKVVKLVQFP